MMAVVKDKAKTSPPPATKGKLWFRRRAKK
jgi:hypothetical protein